MANIPVGVGAYRRNYTGAPEIQCENRYAEKTPTNLVEKVALIGRPGTELLDDFTAWVTVTMTIASPAVVTWTGHPWAAGDAIMFQTTGALPTGVTAGTTYYVISTGLTANAFQFAATSGGTSINSSGTQSGVHTARRTSEVIRGLYSKEGLFSGDLFVVSGPTLYRVNAAGTITTISGTVPGKQKPYVTWMKGVGYEYLFISDGLTLQYYGGGALTAVAMPGSVASKALCSLGSFVLVSVGSTRKFFFIRPGEVTIDSLDFAEKESNPDNILDMLTIGDKALIMGNGSTESWYATGDDDAPFAPTAGLAYQRGVVEGTAVVVKETVILISNDGIVYAIGSGVERISDHSIEERIRKQLRREQGLT